MKSLGTIMVMILAAILLFGLSAAQGSTDTKPLQQMLDSARAVEAPVFAPVTYLKAARKLDEIREAIRLEKKQQSIDQLVSDFNGYAENALKATGVAKLSLSEYLAPRNKARAAKAQILVPELYQKAEDQFIKGTSKVESGDVKGGLKEAEKASPQFDTAEMEAIRVDVLGNADKLIAAAVADEATKYAFTTLDKAKTAREKANDILNGDRYERKQSVAFASRAEYEARHASNIAQSVRALERNDQAWEKLMLGYEIEMQKAATAAGVDLLRFDNGPMAAADTLVARIKGLKGKVSNLEESSAGMQKESEETSSKLVNQLQVTLAHLGEADNGQDPLVLAQKLDDKVSEFLAQKAQLDSMMQAKQGELAQLEKTHEEVSAELQARQAKEEKLKQAKTMINPSEGEILFNATNDIVLRLTGLAFASGKSDIADAQVPILNKAIEIIKLFPDSKLMIEGHTDNAGDPGNNTRLSEKRAIAVMQFIRQALSIPAEKITSAGYGSDRPVASNATADGRAKNRRIDIIIMQ
ncbi:exported hypothetical protein [Candidatus Zixiibacteriota bacterium]|nr:exported hypothetical protein [candidate division Zixibacteria bacterium]